MVLLDTPITKLELEGPRMATALKRLGIATVYDLIHYYPTRWDFAPEPGPVEGQIGKNITVAGKVIHTDWLAHEKKLHSTIRIDDGCHVDITWFNGRYAARLVSTGKWIIAYGKFTTYGLTNPEFRVAPRRESLPPASALNVVTYPISQYITSNYLKRLVQRIPDSVWSQLPEYYRTIHQPRNAVEYERAVELVKYDELYYMQLGLALRKHQRDQVPPNVTCIRVPANIAVYFPFTLTNDQQRAIEDIVRDLSSGRAMNRLLLGDVGSGKTAVAAYAAVLVAMNGGRTAILCPTQILAKQHYGSFQKYFDRAGLKCDLIIGPTRGANNVTADVVIGTTSILRRVNWGKLGLVVIDEQHKFGVEQRAELRKHGNPHCLVMTATPIPRTIAMTVFGDLDVSMIREMPPGRKPVKTKWVRNQDDEKQMDSVIRNELRNRRQVYVVCPRIEALDDEMRAVEAVADEYASRFPTYMAVSLHSRLSRSEKSLTAALWRAGSANILVSTTVVEVGVDQPNATVMVVEGADRFGLATLHQLRGRVGRSTNQAYCFLLSDASSTECRKRMSIMERTNDGFEIAEEDLKLRGPGDLLSTRQHGLPDLRLADPAADYDLLLEARKNAKDVVAAGIGEKDFAELTRRFGNGLALGDV